MFALMHDFAQFEEMAEDDINVMLLTVEANVLFNEKKNAVQLVKH